MKRYIYILLSITLCLVCSCAIDKNDDLPYKDAGILEVSFADMRGSVINNISLSPVRQKINVNVMLNIEDVKWVVESDSKAPWCTVDDTIHEGSDTFEITVDAWDGYDQRSAKVSLSAGEYCAVLEVSQNGNVFVLDRNFGLAPNTKGSAKFILNVKSGVEWEPKCDEWLHFTKELISESDENEVYEITLQWDENTSDSRLGGVKFYRGDEENYTAQYAVWQFGSSDEYGFEDGTLLIPAHSSQDKPLVIKTPKASIGEICELIVPQWANCVKNENVDEGNVSWSLTFNENPSDCYQTRDFQLAYVTEGTTDKESLAEIHQEYYVAKSILSPKGLALFAEKFNEGGEAAVGDWMNEEGIVEIKNDIDMSEFASEWISIGAKDNEFNLNLDGCKSVISGFSTNVPLLGECDGAVISNVVFDNTCKVIYEGELSDDLYLASLAAKAINTTITGCESAAEIRVVPASAVSSANLYIGGLVGSLGENSSIRESVVTTGSLNVAEIRATSSAEVCIGGVAGVLDGEFEMSASAAPITCDLTISGFANGGKLMVGGVAGFSGKASKFTSAKWDGVLEFQMPYSASNKNIDKGEVCIGGILGASGEDAVAELIGAETSGTILINASKNNKVYWKTPTSIGGVVGCAFDGCNITNSTNNATLDWQNSSNKAKAGGFVSSGGIVGRINKGLARISGCTNNNAVKNIHTHYAMWSPGKLSATRTGGIIGTYGYAVKAGSDYEMDYDALPYDSNNITISDCHVHSLVIAQRGLVGGIAGYLYNATVTNCEFKGGVTKERFNCTVGGIAGAVERTSIEDSEVVAPLYGVSVIADACDFKAGGIAACLFTESRISNCKYSGQITTGANKTDKDFYGGIVGEAQAGCKVEYCSYRGSLPSATDFNTQITIDAENYSDHIIGNNAITAENCTYWEE